MRHYSEVKRKCSGVGALEQKILENHRCLDIRLPFTYGDVLKMGVENDDSITRAVRLECVVTHSRKMTDRQSWKIT